MTFAKDATQGNAAEVKLGQLASEKGQNQQVRDFGKRMVTDHSKAADELSAIVQKQNIQVPSGLNAKDNSLLTRLSALSGSAFDKAYMSAMVKDHENDIAAFQNEANTGRDSDLKAFANQTLPTLQEHLRLAEDAAKAVGAQH